MSINKLGKTPNLDKIVQCISGQSSFQKKSLRRHLENVADESFRCFAEDWITRLLEVCDVRADGHEDLARHYVNYTKGIRAEEMRFAKSRDYRHSSFDAVLDAVYSREDYMKGYCIGLGLTQLFWPSHYRILRFFMDNFAPVIRSALVGAEIGVGHGLFHAEMLRAAPDLDSHMIDVSRTSLEFTKKILIATGLQPRRTTSHLCDVQRRIPIEDASLDVLLMGEIIEHLESGDAVMRSLTKKMAAGGVCFFTTAANAPAEDHLLLFRSTKDIRDLLLGSGWSIQHERVDTLAGMTVEEAEAGGHNINFAAILQAA